MPRRLGDVLKSARLRTRLSQSAVAKRAGLAASVLSNIESGKRTSLRFETVARIAQSLGISLDTIAHECGFRFTERNIESISTDLTRLTELLKAAESHQQQGSRATAEAKRVVEALGRSAKRR